MGQMQVSDIITSIVLFLPLFIFLFALLYLLSSHILNKLQDHKFIQRFLVRANLENGEPELKYYLPVVYRILGILLLLSTILLSYLDHHILMLFLIFFLVSYYIKTPYKIEIKGYTYTAFLLTGKQKIQGDDVRAVKLGIFHNRVDCSKKFIYLSHFLTNISSLTRKFAKTTGTESFDQSRWDAIVKNNDSPSFWIYRAIILIVFSFLSSVLGVLYFIYYVKQMH